MAFEKQGFENVKIKISDQKAWAKMKVDQTKKNKTKKKQKWRLCGYCQINILNKLCLEL